MQFNIPYDEQDSISVMNTENQTQKQDNSKKKNKAERIVEKYP